MSSDPQNTENPDMEISRDSKTGGGDSLVAYFTSSLLNELPHQLEIQSQKTESA